MDSSERRNLDTAHFALDNSNQKQAKYAGEDEKIFMSLGSSIPNYNDYNTQERTNGRAIVQDSAEVEQSRLLESLEKLDGYNHQSVSTTEDKKSVQTPAFD